MGRHWGIYHGLAHYPSRTGSVFSWRVCRAGGLLESVSRIKFALGFYGERERTRARVRAPKKRGTGGGGGGGGGACVQERERERKSKDERKRKKKKEKGKGGGRHGVCVRERE